MKHLFLNQRVQEHNTAMIQVLQNLAMQLEDEQCWRQGKLIENTVKILLQAENYKQRVITLIETEIKNALDSD
ncbi:hypothetical protein CEN50_11665 [Fischerella thermalis CCMEE 5268]|uniref:Uncharacterized protein n=1 Tax=Fischerella thermalis CCMEE 5268 TaxID=2019662 RepID=A0A2N6KGC1_9CYAN|nr:hypothetical protein [Fischerella thermalis]PLZ98314.1 hypothetical protein CEN50_11665 [Fischerella thermalis CCMEE 5268]PMB47752.1 hypothetical protein CEN40_08320 [Fischerella thermalis CCMEE 5205]